MAAHRLIRVALAASALLAAPAAAAQCPAPVAPGSLRYDEDNSGLTDPACRNDLPARLKHVPLAGPEAYLSFGGELRLRGEAVHRPGFGLDQAEDQVLLERLLVHADLHLGPAVRLFVQLGSFHAQGREGAGASTDEDRLDLTQGFIDLAAGLGAGRATLRGGRQEVTFGSGRLISVRESPNVRRSFDGGRGFWAGRDVRIDGFFLQPVTLARGVFDDATNDAERIWGVHATVARGARGLDAYFLDLRRDRGRFLAGTGREERRSLGVRLFGRQGGFDWDVEGVWQWGRFAGGDISAWTIATDQGWTADHLPWSPRFGLKADIASGDGDPADGTLGTFNALYPKLPYFTEAGLVYPANIVDLHPRLALSPPGEVTLTAGANFLWRHRRGDAFYAPPLVPVELPAGSGRYLATQIELAAEWSPARGWEVKGWYVHAFAGDALRAAGGGDVDFLAASVAWKF